MILFVAAGAMGPAALESSIKFFANFATAQALKTNMNPTRQEKKEAKQIAEKILKRYLRGRLSTVEGKVATLPDGTEYQITERGWRRIQKPILK